MSDQFIGEIRLVPYNFAPQGWAFCDGQILAITQNTALFSLIGTFYGGNGTSTFALPDLRGRFAIASGQGPELASYALGQTGGAEMVTLSAGQLPAHDHGIQATAQLGTTDAPSGAVVAQGGSYGAYDNATDAAPTAPAGGSQPFDNRGPFLVLNYIIALVGIFPSRN